MSERIYQEALGIATGDIIRTSYDTGPYEVWAIHGPSYVTSWLDVETMLDGIAVRDYQVIGLSLIGLGDKVREDYQFYSISDVRREGDRWFTDHLNSEVFVEKRTSAVLQADLFASVPPEPAPYRFTPGVTYLTDPDHDIRPAWRCDRCRRDFNAPYRTNPAHIRMPALCRRCSWPMRRVHVFLRSGVPA